MKQLDLDYSANGGKINFTESQLIELERNFQYAHILHPCERFAIAYQLSLPEKAVNDWFENRLKKFQSERVPENIKIQAGPCGRLINMHNVHEAQVNYSFRFTKQHNLSIFVTIFTDSWSNETHSLSSIHCIYHNCNLGQLSVKRVILWAIFELKLKIQALSLILLYQNST